tara:strand:- start:1643 stop:2335 length:693 start_codon:yes stop_codon:yes gene_type:complete
MAEVLGDGAINPARGWRELFKNDIENYSKNLNMATSIYKEILRGLLSQIKLGFIDDQSNFTNVKIAHGRQERTVAKKFQENNLVLPFSTVYQSAVTQDDDKRRFKEVLVTSSKWNDETQRAERIVGYSDVPIKAEYTLSVWTKYVSDMDQLSASIRLGFNPHKLIVTPFSEETKAYLNEEADMSTTEAPDREDRLLKRNFTITIEGYIPSPTFKITNTGKIIHLNTEIWV